MTIFIEKIFTDKIDELVHLQFQKFSRGTFTQRALIEAKFSKNNYTINTSNEYANDLVRLLAKQLENKETQVKGSIISTQKLNEEANFNSLISNTSVTQFMGVKQFKIDQKLKGEQIITLCNATPTAFMALSFNTEKTELKIKPKAPKSAKPSTKSDKKPKVDFCKIKTTDTNIVKNLLFDIPQFKTASIEHTYQIDDIIIPQGITNPLEMRTHAKRIGTIIRKTTVDGIEKTTTKKFTA